MKSLKLIASAIVLVSLNACSVDDEPKQENPAPALVADVYPDESGVWGSLEESTIEANHRNLMACQGKELPDFRAKLLEMCEYEKRKATPELSEEQRASCVAWRDEFFELCQTQNGYEY